MDEINNQKVIVQRGTRGNCTAIPIRELVVGDIVNLNQGDRVPADCILIDEMMMKVDQSIYFSPDERKDQVMCSKSISIYERKDPQPDGNISYEDDHLTNPDPFLFSDSKIMAGHGKALVCQVGENTLLAKTRRPEDLYLKEEYTYLETRLDVVAE